MARPQDRRVERTRKALRGALIELILEKGYEAISVCDIVERANIGRSTFYMHYSSRDAVFSDSFRALEISLRAALQNGDNRQAPGAPPRLRYTGLLFAHVDDHRHLYRALAGQRGGVLAAAHIRRILFDLVREDFQSRPGGRADCPTAHDGAVHFVVGAITGVLSWWLEHKTAWNSEQVDGFLATMIAPGLSGVFGDRDMPGEV